MNGRAAGKERPPKSQLRQWGEALVFAFVVMLIVRTLFFDLYRIPTPSMEKSLLVGDYLFVSKLHYGTRLPMTIGVPFTGLYLHGLTFPYVRLPGFDDVDRGDAVVFNYPPAEKPIDRKMHYIKRVVGLPGETVEVRDKVVYVDGEALPLAPDMQQVWNVYKEDGRYRIPETRLLDLGVTGFSPTQNPALVRIQATPEAVEEIRTWPFIARVEPYVQPADAGYSAQMYPPGRGYTPDNYGPVTVPAEGMTVTLTDANWPVFGPVIRDYEGHTARQLDEDTFEIDGEQTATYTFEQDYYFVMGDSRDNSQDSRFWGFVPMSHIVGKAVMTYFSWDAESNLPRFGRILRPVS